MVMQGDRKTRAVAWWSEVLYFVGVYSACLAVAMLVVFVMLFILAFIDGGT
jgi:hypothetical protein